VSARVASLPMYDVPELRPATDALWAAIADGLERRGQGGVPAVLERGRPLESVWLDPELLLGQTCGYCVTHALRGRVRLVATPIYAAPGCEGSSYASYIVVPRSSPAARLEDLRGRVAGINNEDSHSGMNALRHAVAPFHRDGRFFDRVEVSGGHRANLELLAAGAIDVAAIDCVSFALLERVIPGTIAAVRVIGRTPAVPGTPLITRAGASDAEVEGLRAAVGEAIAVGAPGAAGVLLIEGVETVPLERYAAIDALEDEAASRGYASLG
jgi:hypothetical protein